MAFSHYGLIRFVGQLGFFSHSQNTLEEVKSLNSEDPPHLEAIAFHLAGLAKTSACLCDWKRKS